MRGSCTLGIFALACTSCLPKSTLSPPSDDERLIAPSEGAPAGPTNPQIRPLDGAAAGTKQPLLPPPPSPSSSVAPELPVVTGLLHEVTRVPFPSLALLGETVLVFGEGRMARAPGDELAFDDQLAEGLDFCGDVEVHLLGRFPERAWLQAKFPPWGEVAPRDAVYRFAPGAKRWVPVGARLRGGANLMVWGDALIGYETHWGARVEGASLRKFDGTLPGPLPAFRATLDSNCPDEFGGLGLIPLGDWLLVTKASCDETSMTRTAVFWTGAGQRGDYVTLPLTGESLSSGPGGPQARAGDHVWVSFEGYQSGKPSGRLLHFHDERWESIELPGEGPLISLAALPTGELWMVASEASQGARLLRRSSVGTLERVVLPSSVGEPLRVVARAANDVWVAGTDGVAHTKVVDTPLVWERRPCSSERD